MNFLNNSSIYVLILILFGFQNIEFLLFLFSYEFFYKFYDLCLNSDYYF